VFFLFALFNGEKNMSNENNAATHFDLHTTGVGYLNRAREVKPQSGKKFKPFWSVGISALHGSVDDVEYSRIDTIIVGTDACELIKQYKEDINQQDSRVICGFKVGDIYAEPYKNNDGEDRAVIKGRLLYISIGKSISYHGCTDESSHHIHLYVHQKEHYYLTLDHHYLKRQHLINAKYIRKNSNSANIKRKRKRDLLSLSLM